MKIEENEVYTTKEVAQILKVSLPTIKRMLKDKRLPSIRIGKQHRFLGKDILAIMTVRNDATIPAAQPATPVYAAPVNIPPPQSVVAQEHFVANSAAGAAPGAHRIHKRFGLTPETTEQEPPMFPEQIEPAEPVRPEPPPVAAPPYRPPSPADLMPNPKVLAGTSEQRQRAYMLGKTLLRDIFDNDGNLLFEQGCVVTDLMIETSRKRKRFMELFSAIEHE